MIDLKTWGEFMFSLWKTIKKYQTVDNCDWPELMDEVDRMMEAFPLPVFRSIALAFLEQKSMEGIRNEQTKV